MSPLNLRPRQHELAGVVGEDLALLADRPLHERAGADVVVEVHAVGEARHPLLLLEEPRDGVVHDLAAAGERRLDLDRLHPALLGQAGLGEGPPPLVLAVGGHVVGGRGDDEVGLAEAVGQAPRRGVGPLDGGRQVGAVAHGGAAVHPLHDGVDLRLAQRPVVLERLDADGAVDVPGRHLERDHAVADGPRPGPHLAVGQQRHRGDGVGLMALLALLLENRRDVLRERRLVVGLVGRGETGRGDERGERPDPEPPPVRLRMHGLLLPSRRHTRARAGS